MANCNTRNPAPPCKEGFEEKLRPNKAHLNGSTKCCYAIPNFKKKQLAKAKAVEKKKEIAKAKGKDAKKQVFCKEKTSQYTSNRLCSMTKTKDLNSKNCVYNNKTNRCNPRQIKQSIPKNTVGPKKNEDVVKDNKSKGCNNRNPAPPCPEGKEIRTTVIYERDGSIRVEKTKCCYAIANYKKKGKKAIVKKTVVKTDTPKKNPIYKRRRILNKLRMKGNFTRVTQLTKRFIRSGPFDKEGKIDSEIQHRHWYSPRTTITLNGLFPDGAVVVDRMGKSRGLMPKEQKQPMKPVAAGSFNTVWKTNDGKYAYRVNKEGIHPRDKSQLSDVLGEGILTIRLSELAISPSIKDYYFARTSEFGDIGYYYVVQVTELSKYGSLSKYFEKQPTRDIMKNCKLLATQTIGLYKRMCDNYIFCTDVKPHNMIVTNEMQVRIIDFDNTFCASKDSPFNRNINTMLKDLNELPRPSGSVTRQMTRKDLVRGFLTLNLIQVGGFAVEHLFDTSGDVVLDFAKYLMKEVSKEDLEHAIVCSELQVGDHKPIKGLTHYICDKASEQYLSSIAGTVFENTNINVVILVYLLNLLGPKRLNAYLNIKLQDALYKVPFSSGLKLPGGRSKYEVTRSKTFPHLNYYVEKLEWAIKQKSNRGKLARKSFFEPPNGFQFHLTVNEIYNDLLNEGTKLNFYDNYGVPPV